MIAESVVCTLFSFNIAPRSVESMVTIVEIDSRDVTALFFIRSQCYFLQYNFLGKIKSP
jgi:hypothetical protein